MLAILVKIQTKSCLLEIISESLPVFTYRVDIIFDFFTLRIHSSHTFMTLKYLVTFHDLSQEFFMIP